MSSNVTTNNKIVETVLDGNNLLNGVIKKEKSKIIHGLTGIINTTNTCYMNSAIQAFSHLYPLTNYFFENEKDIINILLNNAKIIFKDDPSFSLKEDNTQKIDSGVPLELRKKIHQSNYNSSMLTEEEKEMILNRTMTYQLIKLLKCMWKKNCVVLPVSFRTIFSEARNKFFFGNEHQDAEEAYSCILQKIQEELAEKSNVIFKPLNQDIGEFLEYKNYITDQLRTTNNLEIKERLLESYQQKKNRIPNVGLIIQGYRMMKEYYDKSYSKITKIFSGFLYNKMSCPETGCGFFSNKFDPFLSIQLPLPVNSDPFKEITIEDCMKEYCNEEILDENNLWTCDKCNKGVMGIKKLQLWTCPPILVIQFKRFNYARRSKNSRMIKYPMNDFDIRPMMSPIHIDPTKSYKYTLQCVVNHTGGLDCGHYYSYCKDEDTDKWFKFNDTIVTEISPLSIISKEAYLLFYVNQDLLKQT